MHNNSILNSEYHFLSPRGLKYGIGKFLLIFLLMSAVTTAYSKLPSGKADLVETDSNVLFNPNVSFNSNISFIENIGQIVDQNGEPRPDIKFLLDYKGLKIQFKENSFSYERYSVNGRNIDSKTLQTATINSHRVDIEIVGANKSPEIIAKGPSELRLNYFIDGRVWVGARCYQSIIYKNIYPKIDLAFYVVESEEDRNIPKIKYDFIVRPGGNSEDIELKFSGDDGLSIDDNGGLIIGTSQGSIIENAPITYSIKIENYKNYGRSPQKINIFNNKTNNNKSIIESNIIESNFKLDSGRLSFECSDYDKSKVLIIDPQLVWGTYFGGSGTDLNAGVAVDPAGNIIIAGSTSSTNRIATSGAYKTTKSNGFDTFIAKFTPAGVQLWGTYYGGGGNDLCSGITIDGNRNIIICGATSGSDGISTAGTHQPTYGGGSTDGFVAKFNSGGILTWGTYFGGREFDKSNDINTDAAGNIYTAGSTGSSNSIATTGAHQTTPSGSYIAKFNSSGQLIWGTYYGGGSDDIVWGIDVKSNGTFAICGVAESSTGIATSGAYKENPDGTDAFLALFDSSGTRQWGTYFGGTNYDELQSILFDNNGDIVSCGTTSSTSAIATAGAHQTSLGGGFDGMLIKFNTAGELIRGTYYGGSGTDFGFDIEKGNEGNLVFTGITTSPNNISTPGVHQTQINGTGSYDAFVVKFNSSGGRQWGTYFGGANNENSGSQQPDNNIIAVDGLNNIILSGTTLSIDGIATPGAHQENFRGLSDCFIAKIKPYPQRLTAGSVYGPFCAGGEFDVEFLVGESFGPGNTFTAELSGPDGDFNNSKIIGSAKGRNSGIIAVKLPRDLSYGTKYRIRINANNPATNGLDNGIDIVIYPLPQPKISGQFDVCVGSIVSYTASDSAGRNLWEVAGGDVLSPPDSTTVTIQWGAIGKGSIVLSRTVDSSGCENSDTVDVDIIERPAANFDIPESVCQRSVLPVSTLTDENEKVNWLVGSGIILGDNDSNNVEIIWDSAGEFDIRLIKWNTATLCEDTLIKKITVLESPRADIVGTNAACENQSNIYFAVDSNNIESRWKVDGGSINGSDNEGHVIIDWGLSGSGNIRLEQRNIETGCADTLDYPIIISKFPTPDFTAEPDVCQGEEIVYFSNSAAGVDNKWEVSGGVISGKDDSSEVVIIWEKAGEGEITLTQRISGSDCVDSIKISATVHPKPDPEILGEYNICANITNEFRAGEAEGVDYVWTANDGEIFGSNMLKTVEIKWAKAGTDTIRLIEIITATGCTDSAFIVVDINEFEKAKILASNDKICQYGTLLFSTSSTYDVLWDAGGGKITGDSTAAEVEIVWDNSGDYEVKLIYRNPDNDCSDTAKINITVYSLPKPIITGTDASCTGCMESYTSAHIDEIAYWQISGGEIVDSAGNNEISVKWTDPNEGIVKLILINSVTGCRDSVELNVDLSGPAGNSILGNGKVCSGAITEYKSKQTFNSSFEWLVSGGTVIGAADQASVMIQWPEQGEGQIILYHVNLLSDIKDTSYLDVEIMSSPIAVISGFNKANRNSRLQYATSIEAGINISWSVSGGSISGSTSANVIDIDWGPAGSGSVQLIKTDEINNCSDTARLEVLIIDSDANAILSVDRLGASPGDKVVVPIRLSSSRDLTLAGVSGFETELRFNATVLTPSGGTPAGTVIGGVRTIPLTLSSTPIRDNILAEFDFTATLGNTQNTILSLTDPQPVGGLAVVNQIGGRFQLTGLCQEGGTRLVINTKERSLGQNTPNPANESTEIIYTLIEPGPVSVELYNLYGELISVIENGSKSPGTYSLKFNTASLPSGTYLYMLKTPTKILSRVMKVLH